MEPYVFWLILTGISTVVMVLCYMGIDAIRQEELAWRGNFFLSLSKAALYLVMLASLILSVIFFAGAVVLI